MGREERARRHGPGPAGGYLADQRAGAQQLKDLLDAGKFDGCEPGSYAILVPSGGGCRPGFVRSLVLLAADEAASGRKRFVGVSIHEGTLVARNRNEAAADFILNTAAEWAVCLDDDIEFGVDLFDRLMAGRPADAGVVAAQVDDKAGVSLWRGRACRPGDELADGANGDVVAFGGGVHAVRRSAYLAVARRFGFGVWYAHEVFEVVPGVWLDRDEDMSAAVRFAACGVRMWGRTDVPLVHHLRRAASPNAAARQQQQFARVVPGPGAISGAACRVDATGAQDRTSGGAAAD